MRVWVTEAEVVQITLAAGGLRILIIVDLYKFPHDIEGAARL